MIIVSTDWLSVDRMSFLSPLLIHRRRRVLYSDASMHDTCVVDRSLACDCLAQLVPRWQLEKRNCRFELIQLGVHVKRELVKFD